jgi:hypothetical protein
MFPIFHDVIRAARLRQRRAHGCRQAPAPRRQGDYPTFESLRTERERELILRSGRW